MSLNVAIFSRNFFGAERRFFRIVDTIDREFQPFETRILINSSLWVAARRVSWAQELLDGWAAADRIAVMPDRVSHMGLSRNLHYFIGAVVGRTPLHVVLRARPLAYARALLGKVVGIEVTSPDVADQVGARAPLFFLRRITKFRTVSPAVHARFLRNVSARGGTPLTDKVTEHTLCSATPFIDESGPLPTASEKRNLIVSASRFTKRKNVVLIAKALAEALRDLGDWQALVLGRGEDEADIRTVLSDFIAEGRADVRYETNMSAVLAEARIYVSMIEPDNYPSQSVLEAMKHQNALILSDTGNSGRFISPAKNGVLVPLDASALARTIRSMAGNSAELNRMGHESLAHLRESFSATRHVEELLDLYG